MKLSFLLACFFTISCQGQNLTNPHFVNDLENYARPVPGKRAGQNVRIVFYNVENLYDPYDDTTKTDEEFTSQGAKHWSFGRFQEKLNHLSKTLLAAGGPEPPAIVGMCEVENKYVLNKLVYQSPLKKFRYRIVHHDSPDLRGIDAALIYRPEKFSLISWQCIPVIYPFDTTARTRDILMVKGIIFESDTIILFVNHWPSRRGGYLGSQPMRNFAAGMLRSAADTIFSTDVDPHIIIMNDFNDEPENHSLSQVLRAPPPTGADSPGELINLMYPEKKKWNDGTIRYQGQWSVFDQFIVSGNLAGVDGNSRNLQAEAHIFKGDFLVENDDRYLGEKLKRTYAGPRYLGGFSDHLPVYLDLYRK